MESLQKPTKFRKREIKYQTIYSRSLITRNIVVPITVIGKNVKDVLEKTIANQFEGKCVVEGYVRPGSCKIITYSSGLVEGTSIRFEVVFECQICCPVEGMLVPCVAKNITKAGIRAESSEEQPSPIVVFITRDHQYMNKQFGNVKEGDKFNARIIGQRFELNDKYISIIAELVQDYQPKEARETNAPAAPTKKPKLKIMD
jgi:DNA-directed RNA polymerase subunit E'/Rpb7